MKSLKWLGAAALLMLLAAPEVIAATRVGFVPAHRVRMPHRAAQAIDNGSRMKVNNLDMVVTNHGSLAYDLITGNAGLIYPKGTLKTAVFAAGLWVGAKVNGETRCTVGEYSQEYTPGPMAGGTFQADNPSFHNFVIDRSTRPTGTDLADYIAQGGPLDSTGAPQLLGDATLWSVFNDADPGVHTNEAGSTPPLGIEVQQSVFAYNRSGALGNIIFVKWKIINKGSNTLDSTFVSVWSDPDLGGATDDLVGCDTTLSLGYCYNATNSDALYGSTPPAVGYDFFQGPKVNGVPLPMTSFNKYINGTDPSSPIETYNYMLGLNKNGTPVVIPNTSTVTTFQVSGLDPGAANTATNWLDSNPADRRLMLSSGPFTMAPGDTQEVVTAIIMGQGTDRLSSVNDLKNKDAAAQTVFDLNFDIPQPPPSPTVYVQPLDKAVRLIWDRTAVGTHSANAALGQDFVFEGYRVWQLPSVAATGGAKVIATFDVAGDNVGPIYSDLFNSSIGAVERTLVVNGNDEGLKFQIDIKNDAIRGGPLVNYKDYYFAVTAYSYDSLNVAPYVIGVNEAGIVSDVLESALNPVHAIPRGSNSVFQVPAPQIAGSFVGNQVVVNQVSSNVVGGTFKLIIGPGGTFTIVNAATNDTLVANQTSAIVDGFTPEIIPTTDPSMFWQLKGGTGLLGATDSTNMWAGPAVADSSGTYIISNYLYYPDGPVDVTLYNFDDTVQHDYLIQVLPDTTEYAWAYAGGAPSPQATFKVPVAIYDLGQCSLTDPTDDQRVTAEVRDRNGDGMFDWGDAIYIRNIPYASVAWNSSPTSSDYSPDDEALGRFTFYQAPGSSATLPAPGRFLVRGGALCPGDVFQFKTSPAGSAPGTIVGNDLNKILAVPNPYYAHSQYELTQFDRVLKFTNIPASKSVTVRIFNLAGDLVRTIRRSAANGDDMSSSQIIWNLNTENNLPVASGIYIVRIDVDGVGSKTLRIAVFTEQERLDNF